VSHGTGKPVPVPGTGFQPNIKIENEEVDEVDEVSKSKTY
jgi:hypothetical protein